MAGTARLRDAARQPACRQVALLASLLAVPAGCKGEAGAQEDGPPQVEPEAPLEPWRTKEDEAFAEAKRSGRYVMVDFKADWCQPCKKVEAVLAKAPVHRELTEDFVPLALDISDLTFADNELKAKYKVFNLPAVIFVDAQGKELGRFEGQADPQTNLMAAARKVVADHPRG